MKNMNLKRGLLRLYFTAWVIGSGVTLISSVWWSFFGPGAVDLRYMGLWLGLAVIAPAVALKLLIWPIDRFSRNDAA
jgi:hypothetical protein